MPRKNVSDRSWIGAHHVYNRAKNGRRMFQDDSDREMFVEILTSRLSRAKFRSRRYRAASADIQASVSAMNLMTTHFHLIVWQHESESLRRLMQSVMHAYVLSYNAKHGTHGSMFAGPFRSRPLKDNKEIKWGTAYVHANDLNARFSTHRAYFDRSAKPPWLQIDTVLAMFGGIDNYLDYLR